jgi:regulator of protease activity HflC (stomatin/prohibitin superfamily)
MNDLEVRRLTREPMLLRAARTIMSWGPRAVVLRFGEYVRSNEPGWGWRAWPFETVEKVNVTQVRQVTERSDMLTLDENIVDVEVKVQYRVSDIQKYLFSQSDPDATLRQVFGVPYSRKTPWPWGRDY